MRGIEGGCKLLCKYVNIVVSQLLHSPWGRCADGVVKMRIPFLSRTEHMSSVGGHKTHETCQQNC